MYDAFCLGIVVDQLAHGRQIDIAAEGILHADDLGGHGGFHLRLFEAKVGFQHLTVDQPQVSAVAERLGADDGAVLQGQAVAVPSQIFALDDAIADHHVFCVPEGVLGVEITAFKNAVFNVLEGKRQQIEGGCNKTYRGLPVTSIAFILPLLFWLQFLMPDHVFMILLHIILFVVGFLFILDFPVKKPSLKNLLSNG